MNATSDPPHIRSARFHRPVKLISSVFSSDPAFIKKAEEMLEGEYGRIDGRSGILAFDRTDYYEEEFGRSLKREIVSFGTLVRADDICRVKIKTNEIEKKLSSGGKRRANIDPGYLTDAKLVLLTTKDYSHRIYLGGRIFAEVTLFYKDGSFRAWPWTYPDYASEKLVSFFNKLRTDHLKEISAC